MDLVGKRVMFNPVFHGDVYQSNGIQYIEQCNAQVDDNGVILGTIVKDLSQVAWVAGPIELNGWHFVYVMPKTVITLLDDDLTDTYDGNEINNPG